MRSLFLSAPLILAGCAGATPPNAPSLLPRAIESRSDAEPVVPVQPVTADAALDARIAERVAAFETATAAFERSRASVAARVTRAKGAAAGSEPWLDGQAAIGELQQLRTATDGAIADLEALAIERAAAGAPPYPALDTAIATAQAELDRQAGIEAQLNTALSR